MDDWAIMVKTKHQLRKVIRLTHRILDKLKLKMHPDKTFLGCIKKGFDFLGVHFDVTPSISATTLDKHRTKLAQRYAQGASPACIGDYVTRWTSWCTSVLKCACKTTDFNQSMAPSANTGLSRQDFLKETIHGTQIIKLTSGSRQLLNVQ